MKFIIQRTGVVQKTIQTGVLYMPTIQINKV